MWRLFQLCPLIGLCPSCCRFAGWSLSPAQSLRTSMLQEQGSLSPALLPGLPKAWVPCPGGCVRAYSSLKTHCGSQTCPVSWIPWQGSLLCGEPAAPVLQQISICTNLIHTLSSTHDDAHPCRTGDISVTRPQRPWITYYLPASFSQQLRVPRPQGEAGLARLNHTVCFHKVLGRSKVDLLLDDCVWFS